MKRLLFILAATPLIFATACGDDNNGGGGNGGGTEDGTYKGTVLVAPGAPYTGTMNTNPGTPAEYTLENAAVEMTADENGETATIKLVATKFAPMMPAMDITIPGVSIAENAAGFSLSGDGIIPIAMGGPFPVYTITGLTGEAAAQTLSFEMTCGSSPTSFSGTTSEFTLENASVRIIFSDEGDTVTIKMKAVKFAPMMPAMDIAIPGVSVTDVAGGFTLSGDGIIPVAAGGEFPAYTITGLTGEATSGTLTFEMMCGTYPVSFSGAVEAE